MPNNNAWILPVSVALGAAAFAVAFVVMPQQKKDAPPPVFQAAAADSGNPPFPAPKQLVLPPIGDPVAKPKAKEDTAPAPTPRALNVRTVKLPAPDNLQGLEKGTFDPREITLSPDGSIALAKSKREVNCVSISSGRVLQTFKPAKPRWDYQKPETQFMFLAPDAGKVLVGSITQAANKRSPDVNEITIHDARGGNVLGKSVLDERSGMYGFAESAVFSAGGDYLILPTYHYRDGLLIQAVSTDSGRVRAIDVPAKSTSKSWGLTLAVPREPKLLVHRRGGSKENLGGVCALDLGTGNEKPIKALTVDPWNLFNRGVQLSLDGRLLLSHSLRGLQVCDWRTDTRLLDLKIGELQSYNNGRFTPDGKRVMVEWKPRYQIIHIGGSRGGKTEQVANRIHLYDIASQKKIAEFTPKDHGLKDEINAFTISRDGRKLVWASETNLIAIDFQSAFGIDPLPPAASPAGADDLPLK